MTGGELFERERELLALDALAAEVRQGSGRTAVVEGQPGLGKSTLVGAAARRSADSGSVRVLSFCCGELEHELAWSGVVGLLAPALAELRPAQRARLFTGSVAPAAALLEDPAGAQADPHTGTFAAVHALFALISRLAESRPLLLVLDDTHWCDRNSLRLLSYLQRRLNDIPVGLVMAMRPPPPGPTQLVLERLTQGPDTEVHRLEPLGIRSVSELVRGRGFPDAGDNLCETFWQVTAGNPFYLSELLIELRARGANHDSASELSQVTPPAVLRSLILRLDRLPAAGAAELARAAAVLGEGATLGHAAELAGVPHASAVDALDALAEAELLVAGEPLRFVHPLVRSAVNSDIPAARRAQQHARAAELLGRDHHAPEVVALHLLHAPRTANAATVSALRSAAALAQGRGAPESSVAYLRRALEEPPPPDQRGQVLLELARAETAVGDPEAVARLREALALLGDERERAQVLLELGWAEHHAGRFQAAIVAFERGLELAPGGASSELHGELEAGYLGSATLDSARAADAVARIRVIESGAAEIHSHAQRMLLAQVLFMRTMSGHPHREIIELAQRIWGGGQLLRDEGADSQTLWHVVGALSWADAYGPALDAIEPALAAADERGLALARARACYARAWPNYWMGRIPEAMSDARAAIEIWNGGLETYLPAAIYWFGLAALERGEAEAAQSALGLAGPLERWEGSGMIGFVHGLQGHLHFHAGRLQEALLSHMACGEVMGTLLVSNPSVMAWRSQAGLALQRLGRSGRASELVSEELRLARASGAPRAIGVALRAQGLCSAPHEGIALLREAVEVLEPSGATLELARAQIDLGAAIRRSGRRRDARPYLQRGLELTQDGGATELARRAQTELRAAGGRGRRPVGTGVEMLTASERRVAELAADGHSNRYIAGLLQVSIKAVEWHLHQSYRKLDITGRGQLPSALASS